ncbi:MAG TPA: hypothetical protein VMZ74_10495 [Ramlibacter sp.]|nr:hypothetical protein [Ramlibacter sp.]
MGRRNWIAVASREAAIAPLLDGLDFIGDRARWGYKFRFGLFEIGPADMQCIAGAMAADARLLYFPR